MQAKRDELHRHIMPDLRKKAAEHYENLQFADLRWGISTADLNSEESAQKVLNVCLEEVQRCKPYMIVFLGERYGWVPPAETLLRQYAEHYFSTDPPEKPQQSEQNN